MKTGRKTAFAGITLCKRGAKRRKTRPHGLFVQGMDIKAELSPVIERCNKL